MASIVEHSLQIEIENGIVKVHASNNDRIPLPLVNEVAECDVKVTNENKMYMLLQCPEVCVQNGYTFAVKFKLGRLLLNSIFKKIEFRSILVSLGNLTVNEVIAMSSRLVKNQRGNGKVCLTLVLTIKCEGISATHRLLQDIAAPELADFTFVIDGKQIPAHKFILRARSPVFARMLSNNSYKETQSSVMQITDTTAKAFHVFLEFMYKASVPNLSTNLSTDPNAAANVIKLAEKYDVSDLKKICEPFLLAILTDCNCVATFMFAHRYNCSQELITKSYKRVEEKYFRGKKLPPNLCDNPKEVQRLVDKMEEFEETLQEISEDLTNSRKKVKRN